MHSKLNMLGMITLALAGAGLPFPSHSRRTEKETKESNESDKEAIQKAQSKRERKAAKRKANHNKD